jgi:hypothetical protein
VILVPQFVSTCDSCLLKLVFDTYVLHSGAAFFLSTSYSWLLKLIL